MNKVITTQGNVQFQFPDGKIVNVHPNHIYTVFNEDTVSFILVGLPKTSGLSTMTSKAEDLELNGAVYSFAELPNAVSEAFAIAGAQARCEIVDELPESGYTNTIYLVPQEEGEGYDEYIWLKDEERWELIGNTDIEMKNYLKKVDFNAYSAATKVDIDNEISARTASDTALDNKIDALSASTDEAISGLSDSIDAEITAREAADGVISGAVDTVSSGLTEEIQRAQNAESGLSDAIDAVSGNVETEEARAEGVENAISGALDTHIQDEVRHISGAERTSWNEKTKTISLTQAEYDALPSSAKTDATKLYVISDALPIDLSVYAKVSALTEEISARTDADTALDNKINAVSAATDTALANKQNTLIAGENIIISSTTSGDVISSEGGSITVDTALDSGSTNPVENQALWDELRLGGAGLVETTLTFEGGDTTNYPNGCTKIKIEGITSMSQNAITFENETSVILGTIDVMNWGSISVDTSRFQGASYEISGTTVIISYPTVTTVTKLHISSTGTRYTYKAIYNDPLIVLKDQVTANTAAIESKVDTTTFNSYASSVDSALGGKLNISDYVVDSIITQGSTNPVQGNTLYNELRVASGGTSDVVLSFDGNGNSTNYPTNCRQLMATLDTTLQGSLTFKDSYGVSVGTYTIVKNNDWYDITNNLNGSTYEVSNNILTISYPSIGNISIIVYSVSYGSLTPITAVGSALYIPLKDQVVSNTTALGGMKIVKLTESEYQSLSVKDQDTLYVVIPDPTNP